MNTSEMLTAALPQADSDTLTQILHKIKTTVSH